MCFRSLRTIISGHRDPQQPCSLVFALRFVLACVLCGSASPTLFAVACVCSPSALMQSLLYLWVGDLMTNSSGTFCYNSARVAITMVITEHTPSNSEPFWLKSCECSEAGLLAWCVLSISGRTWLLHNRVQVQTGVLLRQRR